MHGDAASFKWVLVESFSDIECSKAMKVLWDYFHSDFKSLSYTYHNRRATNISKPIVNDAISDDVLFVWEKLNPVDSIPPNLCAACDFLRLSPSVW